MDIIFKNEAPTAAVPGGSVFNAIISLGRMKQNVTMISETGNDHVGHAILRFMKENGVSTENVNVFSDGRSAISLAWLDNGGDADYMFYKLSECTSRSGMAGNQERRHRHDRFIFRAQSGSET